MAATLGMPVFVMKSLLPYSEYNRWARYFVFKQPDETEIQLAVLSNLVASGLGAKNTKVTDFLINKPHKAKTNSIMTSSEVASVFGGVSTKG